MAEEFYYVEGSTSVKEFIKNITKEIIKNAGIHKWNLVFPGSVEEIKDYAIVSTTTNYGKTFYLKMEREEPLNPNSSEQSLLDKEKYSKAFTLEEQEIIKRHLESLDYTSSEKNLIKKDTYSDSEQAEMMKLRTLKNITEDRELELLRKYYKGISMSTSEQQELEAYRDKHNLTPEELIKYNKVKKNRRLNYSSIELVLSKQFYGIELTQSDQNVLASYRTSMDLNSSEKEKLAAIKAHMDNRNHIYMSIGTEVKDIKKIIDKKEVTVKDLPEDNSSVPARLAWYRKIADNIGEWLPVQYWLNVTKNAFNLVLRGDPSADNYPYDNFLISYAYCGAVKPMEDSAFTDDKYNFALTTSSDIEPFYSQKFGERTGTGITDVVMVGNKIGMPYQPHYPAFYTTATFMDKCNTEGSRWNHKKHQFSDVTLVHPVDMERGKMENVLTGDASAIFDMDKLAYHKGEKDEEYYKKFKISAPYSFLNNAPNNLYAVAIRCYKTTE